MVIRLSISVTRLRLTSDRKYCDQPGYERSAGYSLQPFRPAGVGLNFTGATEMILMDEEWKPGYADQGYGSYRPTWPDRS